MATLSAGQNKGVLTGSGTQDIVAQADAGSVQETYVLVFRNYSAGDVTLELFAGGTTATDQIAEIPLATGEMATLHISLGPGGDVRAEASAGTAIAWFKFEGVLA